VTVVDVTFMIIDRYCGCHIHKHISIRIKYRLYLQVRLLYKFD